MRQLFVYVLLALLSVNCAAEDTAPEFLSLDTAQLNIGTLLYQQRLKKHERHQKITTAAMLLGGVGLTTRFFYPEIFAAGYDAIAGVGNSILGTAGSCADTLLPEKMTTPFKTVHSWAMVRRVAGAKAAEGIPLTTTNWREEIGKDEAGLLGWCKSFAKAVGWSMMVGVGGGIVKNRWTRIYEEYNTAWAIRAMCVNRIVRRAKQHAAALDPNDGILNNNNTLQIQIFSGNEAYGQIDQNVTTLDSINDILALNVYVKSQKQRPKGINTEEEFGSLVATWNQFVMRIAFVLAALDRQIGQCFADEVLEREELKQCKDKVLSLVNEGAESLNEYAKDSEHENLLAIVYRTLTDCMMRLEEATCVDV